MWLLRYHFIVLLYAFFVHHTYKNLRIDEEVLFGLHHMHENVILTIAFL